MWSITHLGRQAWETADASIPEDYRRLLWLIDVQGDTRAIQELSRQHPQQLLADWLSELEELGFLRAAERTASLDRTSPMAITEEVLQASVKAAGTLARVGAYLSQNRPARGAASRPREDTTILIVEDDQDQLALADLRVTMAGYRVRAASTVQELMRSLLDDGAPELLLLDVMLPDGDGFDVLDKLRRHPRFASLAIVLLTAKREPDDIARGLALGADGYVAKPYSKNVLAGVISGVLE